MKVLKLLSIAFTALLIASCGNTSKVNDQSVVVNNSAKAIKFRQLLEKSPSIIEDKEGTVISSDKYSLEKNWEGNICKTVLTNTSKEDIHPKDVMLFYVEKHGINSDSPIYGEGFQMLHQNGGTLGQPQNIGSHSDVKHYRIKQLKGLQTAYGLLNINVDGTENFMLGFTSCNKFIGELAYDKDQLIVGFDTEGLSLAPGESWTFEDFIFIDGENQGDLYDRMSVEITKNHPSLKSKKMPIGWCSWYCYREDITDDIMTKNLDIFSKKVPELKYIQLDDGYQPFMGDWLDPNPKYGDVRKTIDGIADKGYMPAIWVAPFIAQKESRVFQEHPEWFVKNEEGKPLTSNTVTFGGWREGPWYCMDGTHPEVQEHLKNIFKTMREEWGINYFKLDANFWGAIHGGQFHDKSATRIEAYRRGMQAIVDACDENTVILGCNAPIWPSFGLVSAQRTSGDINRSWKAFSSLAQENLSRAWQNEMIWDVDPDCIVQAPDSPFGKDPSVLSEDEWMFHLTSIHATGGLALSGDKAKLLTDNNLKDLKKLLQPTGKGAKFKNTKLEIGVTDLGDKQFYYIFNWSDQPKDFDVELVKNGSLSDYWTEEKLETVEGKYSIKQLPAHSAKLLVVNANEKVM
ncbi:alpha-galactosidase [Flammeovirga yaeyamensis]|uniref:Alpha-galactosidase n=1 Tax=Flammeovirga yaeyamensis TaxID=367791 RepID=A0AAX1NF43_9BACT|nr:glycoside hydrolase family 36 protein [Flammeovirga yaeyamensis]MBB3696524.1 alpha-galactosidase [Flammeovirga yaeyamensis]NMF33204.1 alpha-galactosidase [Flammeovirga yaeyamensis]QWG05516.1 alpha-galactosidase [Flammeovirga yaeyamensis]